ncbi:hypothetical protein [Chryseoglobus sp. 28M-23]|uniref:hypothetical protein n=1 Tax=Chryseoglobus sp. 28M-23 TaxID=2772253 RepID=UPI0017462FFA|nr:hypothetical protein [Chryseoglobus sp. 28M-23]QOD93471.1 hypothetical protein IE160_11290 [Chryseoglobus sp. 28M-23]
MTHSGLRTAQLCLERAVAMRESAERIEGHDDELAAVAYFYSAYHMVKAAFIEDPIFDELSRLQGLNPHLIPDDRFVTHHRGRLGGNGPRKLGVNDIVQILYPAVAPRYIRLHMASIAVRYESGLTAYSFVDVKSDYAEMSRAYVSGELKAH